MAAAAFVREWLVHRKEENANDEWDLYHPVRFTALPITFKCITHRLSMIKDHAGDDSRYTIYRRLGKRGGESLRAVVGDLISEQRLKPRLFITGAELSWVKTKIARLEFISLKLASATSLIMVAYWMIPESRIGHSPPRDKHREILYIIKNHS